MEQVFTVNCRALALFLLFVTLNTCQANSGNPKKVGSKVVLSPGSVSGPITSITWKHNSNLAVEWYGQETEFYPKFKDRCELNTKTGELTFLSVTLEDSGSYTAEINNRVLNPTEIEVISVVPKPTVVGNFTADETQYVLTCEGITTNAGSVTYTWWSGDVKMKSETKELIITKEDKEPSFFCKMKNQFSSERSEEVLNPFKTPPDPGNNGLHWSLILLLVLVAVVIVAVIVGVFIYKHITGKYPPLLLRVRSRFKTFPCCHTDSSQPSPNTEQEPFIKDKKNEETQGSSKLVTINETGVQVTSTQELRTDESTGNINEPETTSETPETQEAAAEPSPSGPSSGISDQPVTTPGTQENQGPPPAKPPRSSSSSDVQVTSPQEEKTDESTGTIKGTENEGPPAESPTPSVNSDQPGTTSETPEDTEAAPKPSPSGPSSGTSDQPEGEEQSKDVPIEANNEPGTTPQTQENQGPPPAEPQRSSSSSDVQVTSPQEEKTDESTGNINGSETPNSEDLNSDVNKTQANETNAEVF